MPNLSGSAGATSSAAAMSDSGSNAKCLANNASTPKLCATTIQGLRPDRASVEPMRTAHRSTSGVPQSCCMTRTESRWMDCSQLCQ